MPRPVLGTALADSRHLTSPDVPSPVVLSDTHDWPEAIAVPHGPQLVLAGPGTGKTEFLARRVAHLLSDGVSPQEVVVLTFSRRAAAELDQRIASLLPRPVSGAAASTFHSFAHRLVEFDRHRRGQPMPVLLTGPEQVRIVSRLLGEEDPAGWPVAFRSLLTGPTFAAEVADFVMRCHERLVGPEELARRASRRADWRALPGFLHRYRLHLAGQGKLDYGMLIEEAVRTAPAHVSRYRYVVVDEYQDTSPAQARLAEAIAAPEGNLTVAADFHQSIYAFRGADPANVERFHAAHPDGRIVALGRSFRVPAPLLDSALRLVAPNTPGSLTPPPVEPAPHPGEVEVYTFDQRSAEAEWIAGEVERLVATGETPLRSIAVLVRSTRHLLPELSRALDRRGIPHDRPDRRLVDHPAIRLVADLVEAAISPPAGPEHHLAVRRLLLGPVIGLALGREREIVRVVHRSSLGWAAVLRWHLPELEPLAALIEEATWATQLPAVEGFWHLWDRFPNLERIIHDPARSDYRRAWSAFARALERQAERDPTISLAESLAATADFEVSPLLSFTRPAEERLVVTTLHQAKGLEFDVVFIADATEGIFPDTRRAHSLLRPHLLVEAPTVDGPTQRRVRLEEERRLAYTATTRARRRVVWTATTAGIDEGERRPSRFMLAAAGAPSFDGISSPPADSGEPFRPLTLSAAEVQLRRLLLDPAAEPVDRLAALATLAVAPHWDPLSFAGVPERGSDAGLVDGPVRLSPSQAVLYDQCPRRYALERRLGAVGVDSPYLRFGSIVHEVLERTERAAVESGAAHGDLSAALLHLDTVWGRYPPFGPPAFDETWKERARRLLAELYSDWPGAQAPPVALEVRLNATIGGVEWVGRADRIEPVPGGVKIVDYKTSRNPPPLKETARSLQLAYYLLAAAHHPGVAEAGAPVAAELWYPFAARTVHPFDMANLEEAGAKLGEVAAGIRAERWETRVGAHCDRCPFRDVCPAWPEGREAYR